MRGATRTHKSSITLSCPFQPTRPVRGATHSAGRLWHVVRISTHAPRAGRDGALMLNTSETWKFQPTRPVRGATRRRGVRALVPGFQPTRPVRGATRHTQTGQQHNKISTHAPRAGRDCAPKTGERFQRHFNPRAPCGARHKGNPRLAGGYDFNPRAPCGARRAARQLWHFCYLNFNPRAPCGARLNLRICVNT